MKHKIRAFAAIMLMATMFFAIGCTPENDPNQGGVDVEYTYVDLGLPSGTLWATFNVGATTPEGYGDHFAWGETQAKTFYNWTNYRYCNGNYDQLNKYNYMSSYGCDGFTDTKSELEPGDDVATVVWGSEWCMPTYDQWKELADHITGVWTTRNGKNGYLFTAENNKSLFLPAIGAFCNDDVEDEGTHGNYASKTLSSRDSRYAWNFYFDATFCGIHGANRGYGVVVRPVRAQ